MNVLNFDCTLTINAIFLRYDVRAIFLLILDWNIIISLREVLYFRRAL